MISSILPLFYEKRDCKLELYYYHSIMKMALGYELYKVLKIAAIS